MGRFTVSLCNFCGHIERASWMDFPSPISNSNFRKTGSKNSGGFATVARTPDSMVTMTGTQWAIGIACAYFAGSIPFGVLIAKTKGVNIREQGSKNIGATNVGRTLGKTLGLVCFFLDVLKGALPVLVIGLISGLFGKSSGRLLAISASRDRTDGVMSSSKSSSFLLGTAS